LGIREPVAEKPFGTVDNRSPDPVEKKISISDDRYVNMLKKTGIIVVIIILYLRVSFIIISIIIYIYIKRDKVIIKRLRIGTPVLHTDTSWKNQCEILGN